jgi:hypothetical protein
MKSAAKIVSITFCVWLAVAMHAFAQEHSTHERVAQVVALDECDPETFNAALGPEFCHNVALGALSSAM